MSISLRGSKTIAIGAGCVKTPKHHNNLYSYSRLRLILDLTLTLCCPLSLSQHGLTEKSSPSLLLECLVDDDSDTEVTEPFNVLTYAQGNAAYFYPQLIEFVIQFIFKCSSRCRLDDRGCTSSEVSQSRPWQVKLGKK